MIERLIAFIYTNTKSNQLITKKITQEIFLNIAFKSHPKLARRKN